MSLLKKATMLGAAGTAASGSSGLYVEDVFSTYLYTGNDSTQTIENGIALGDFGVGTSTEFDGTNDYLSRSSDLVGNSDGKTFTFSAWIFNSSTGSWCVYSENTYYFSIFGNESQFIFVARNSSNSNILYGEISPSSPVTPNNWHHILFSVDLTNSSNRYLYIDDANYTSSVTWTTYTNDTIDFTQSAHAVGALTNGSYKLKQKLSHIYLDYTYRDLSVVSNRRLFIDANGGSTAPSTLSALSPILYLPMTEDYTIGKNLGTGGDFTANGSPTIVQSGTEYQVGYGAGGLVWTKNRDTNGYYHVLQDTVQGGGKYLSSNVANSAAVLSPASTFSSNGYSINTSGAYFNASSKTYVSWTFRKAPKFFDIVTYTGNGTDRDIAHGLGSEPGMIIIKRTDSSESWIVYHRSLEGSGTYWSKLELESAGTEYGAVRLWGSGTGQDHTSTTFHVSSYGSVNASGGTFVAYLFAHNDGDGGFGESGDQDIIKCGSYTGNGAAEAQLVDIGWEVQWLLVKRTDAAGDWFIVDVMRGALAHAAYPCNNLYANKEDGETLAGTFGPDPRGFSVSASTSTNNNNSPFIYIAIRRPMKTPTSGSEVFSIANNNSGTIYVGFVPDASIIHTKGAWYNFAAARLTGNDAYYLDSANGGSPPFTGNFLWNLFDYWRQSNTGGTPLSLFFKRATGFFDVVCYIGTGSSRTVPHNLGVEPELIIVKMRSYTGFSDSWVVGSTYLPSWGRYLVLHQNAPFNPPSGENVGPFNSTAPTASVFSVGTWRETNGSGYNLIAYLFASQDGISKVGSYTGNGTSQNINCGFSTGARFVLIKRTDASGDWYFWDTTRGIVTGNDPFLALNSQSAENSSYDSVDPYYAGFSVNQDSGTNINVSSGTYIFLAIS